MPALATFPKESSRLTLKNVSIKNWITNATIPTCAHTHNQTVCNKKTLTCSNRCNTHHTQHHKNFTTCIINACVNIPKVAGFCRQHYMVVAGQGRTCITTNCNARARTLNFTYCPTHYKQHLNKFTPCTASKCSNYATTHGECQTHAVKGSNYIIGTTHARQPHEPAYIYYITNQNGIGKIGITQSLKSRLQAHKRQGFTKIEAIYITDTWLKARHIERKILTLLRNHNINTPLTATDMPYGGYTETFPLGEIPTIYNPDTLIKQHLTEYKNYQPVPSSLRNTDSL